MGFKGLKYNYYYYCYYLLRSTITVHLDYMLKSYKKGRKLFPAS